MVPPLIHSRMHVIAFQVTGAVLIVVIDDPAGLQMGINRDRPDMLDAFSFTSFTLLFTF
ncbi:hypothetical protein GCWU000342_00254 [Shuttleworthella satelles DSM 14600]|uniref:Uncharacterized protein n=1 Tax=Shuttleworthella satelles DSM 14600 TaxID=626523 RepID=C4G8F8_9FIRM|nr:hypothetical protein GCWU000342_00254 [Shuttleworthia satelles DSM 14600]